MPTPVTGGKDAWDCPWDRPLHRFTAGALERASSLALAAFLSAGCGGTATLDLHSCDGAGGASAVEAPTTEVTPTCLSYCAAIADKTCFDSDQCHDRCMSVYVDDECLDLIEATLACIPDWLSDTCVISYPDDVWGGCYPETDELLFTCHIAGCSVTGAETTSGPGCTGYASCKGHQYTLACDDSGACDCMMDGLLVGQCGMPFLGNESCAPIISCCRSVWGL